jgi:hypothetical protein
MRITRMKNHGYRLRFQQEKIIIHKELPVPSRLDFSNHRVETFDFLASLQKYLKPKQIIQL